MLDAEVEVQKCGFIDTTHWAVLNAQRALHSARKTAAAKARKYKKRQLLPRNAKFEWCIAIKSATKWFLRSTTLAWSNAQRFRVWTLPHLHRNVEVCKCIAQLQHYNNARTKILRFVTLLTLLMIWATTWTTTVKLAMIIKNLRYSVTVINGHSKSVAPLPKTFRDDTPISKNSSMSPFVPPRWSNRPHVLILPSTAAINRTFYSVSWLSSSDVIYFR